MIILFSGFFDFHKIGGFQNRRFLEEGANGFAPFFPAGRFLLVFTFIKNLGFQKPRFLGQKAMFWPRVRRLLVKHRKLKNFGITKTCSSLFQ